MPTAPPSSDQHPRGLYFLFGTEAFERFSYYGMRALLVLYLTKHLRYERKDALALYGLYTGFVYLTPIVGGFLADRRLGRRKAVLVGGSLMVLGHLAMAFEPLLHLALALLVAGNGFFKPNISTTVGSLYREQDARRDGGFTIFYMGINLGAFLAPLVCGILGERVGWHLGFSAAALGMAGGLLLFVWGQRFLGTVGLPPGRVPETDVTPEAPPLSLVRADFVSAGAWVVAVVVLSWGVLSLWGAFGAAVAGLPASARVVGAAALVVGATWTLFRGAQSTAERQRLAVILVLCAFNVFFWMGFEQAGGTMTLFADKETDRALGGPTLAVIVAAMWGAAFNLRHSTRQDTAGRGLWTSLSGLFALAGLGAAVWGVWKLTHGGYEIPASQFQAINPLLIVALAPSVSQLWTRLDAGRWRTSTPTKMALGMLLLGAGFAVLFAGQRLARSSGPVGPGWLAVVYALHTLGELALSPVGLSMVTKLAPPRVVSYAMGLWLASSAVANILAGSLESLLEARQTPIFAFLIVSSCGPALILLAIGPWLRRWMHGRA